MEPEDTKIGTLVILLVRDVVTLPVGVPNPPCILLASLTKIENDRGQLHKDFYIINTYYDFRDSKKFSPFIGLGIGFVNSVQDSAPFIPEYVRQAFVLQLKAGLSYKFSDENIFYIEGFKRDAKSHTTNDGLGTSYIYEAKDGFDSSGVQVGFRKII